MSTLLDGEEVTGYQLLLSRIGTGRPIRRSAVIPHDCTQAEVAAILRDLADQFEHAETPRRQALPMKSQPWDG